MAFLALCHSAHFHRKEWGDTSNAVPSFWYTSVRRPFDLTIGDLCFFHRLHITISSVSTPTLPNTNIALPSISMELRTSFIYWKVLSCLNVILVYNTIMHKPASFVGYYIGITPQTKSGVRCPLVIMFIGINIMHNISSRAFAVQFDSKKRQVSTKHQMLHLRTSHHLFLLTRPMHQRKSWRINMWGMQWPWKLCGSYTFKSELEVSNSAFWQLHKTPSVLLSVGVCD